MDRTSRQYLLHRPAETSTWTQKIEASVRYTTRRDTNHAIIHAMLHVDGGSIEMCCRRSEEARHSALMLPVSKKTRWRFWNHKVAVAVVALYIFSFGMFIVTVNGDTHKCSSELQKSTSLRLNILVIVFSLRLSSRY